MVLFDPTCKEWLVGEAAVSKAPKLHGVEGSEVPTPSKLYTLLLAKLRGVGEAYMGSRAAGVVIALSPRFDAEQCAVVEKAAAKAGFKTVTLIPSPVAALVGHDLDVRPVAAVAPVSETVLVLHMGGSGVDASLFKVSDGLIESVGGLHDASVGGSKFDDLLVEFCLSEFKKKYRVEVAGHRALSRLRLACEEAKRSLSTNARVPIEIDSLFEGIDFAVNLTRSRFEDICFSLIKAVAKVGRWLGGGGGGRRCG
jgi:L1 cell adhesion molecule like protein